MFTVLDYYRKNPTAKNIEVFSYFETEFEVPKNREILKNEVTELAALKQQLRPIYGKRLDVEERMRYALSDIEMDVFLEYPPRQGSDAQREALRNKLKKENGEYMALNKEYKELTLQINELDDAYKDIENTAKNARRQLETFTAYAAFITEIAKTR